MDLNSWWLIGSVSLPSSGGSLLGSLTGEQQMRLMKEQLEMAERKRRVASRPSAPAVPLPSSYALPLSFDPKDFPVTIRNTLDTFIPSFLKWATNKHGLDSVGVLVVCYVYLPAPSPPSLMSIDTRWSHTCIGSIMVLSD
jgi:hypothetical protein